jgi:hypothetical protein
MEVTVSTVSPLLAVWKERPASVLLKTPPPNVAM